MDIAFSDRGQTHDDLAGSLVARFEQLRPRLTAVCTAIAGPDEAADLVHETYLRASECLHQLRDPALFDAWVVRIALNEAKTVLRRRRRSAELMSQIGASTSEQPDAGLRQLVQQLPSRQRAVIFLHYAYGYRMGEIARLLDLSEINVRTLAFRVRRSLRAQLQESGP